MISFIHSEYLLLLIGVPLLFLFLLYREKVKIRRAAMYGAQLTRSLKGPILIALVASFLIIAIARPISGYEDITLKSAQRDFIVLVDVSLSMRAKDLSPSRLVFAQRKVIDLVEKIKSDSPGDRIGLILFAGDSYLYCPLTSDYGVFKIFLDSLSTDLITTGGSNLLKAVTTATQTIKDAKVTLPRLLLITDGEDNDLSIDGVLKLLHEHSLTLDILGIGTTEGAVIEKARGDFVRDAQGDIVTSRLGEENLKLLAKESGGTYMRARLDTSDLRTILLAQPPQRLTGLDSDTVKTIHQRTIRVYREIGIYFIWAALVVTILGLARALPRYLLPLFLIATAPCASYGESASDAANLYDQGEYDRALSIFEEKHKEDPTDLRSLQGAGNSAFRLQKYDLAERYFSELSGSAREGREKFAAEYNLGNTFFAQKRYQDAIAAYERALMVKPKDEQTTHNLSLAKYYQTLEEEKKKQQDKDEQSSNSSENKEKSEEQKEQNQSDEKDSKDPESPTPSPSPLSSPSSSPSPQPTSQMTATPSVTPSPAENNENASSSPSPTPSVGTESAPSPRATPPPQSDENTGEDADRVSPYRATPTPALNPVEKLRKDEADAWLNSLPDNPVLLRKKVGKSATDNGQSW